MAIRDVQNVTQYTRLNSGSKSRAQFSRPDVPDVAWLAVAR